MLVADARNASIDVLSAIKENSQIDDLRIYGIDFYDIGNEDVMPITDLLEANTALRCFTVGAPFYLSEITLDVLCAAIGRSKSLREIDFSDQCILPPGALVVAQMLATNTTITSAKFGRGHCNEYRPAAAFCDLLWANNYTLCELDFELGWRLDIDFEVARLCKRNTALAWPSVQRLIIDIVVALAPLNLPGYVLLWIIDWLPHLARLHAELKKISLIVNVIGSIRRRRSSDNGKKPKTASPAASLATTK
jgi:hypothetical protein